MKILFPLSIFALLNVFAISYKVAPNDPALENEIKQAYTKFYTGLQAKNIEQVTAACSSHSYVQRKNAIVSAGSAFPQALFESAKWFPKFDFAKFKTLKVKEKGNTAMLVLLVPSRIKFNPFSANEPGEAAAYLIPISCTKEGDTWKYDQSPLNSIEPEDEANLLKGDLSMLDDARYEPSGVVPAVPGEVAAPDYQAQMNISTSGCEITVTLNGDESSYGDYASSARRTGVKKGENKISIKTKVLSENYSIKVSILARASEADEEGKEVFLFEKENPNTSVNETFQVKFD